MEKKYSNDEITVIWKPELCCHTAICMMGLPCVFNKREHPWIKMDAASTSEIIDQVEACPTEALTWYRNDNGK